MKKRHILIFIIFMFLTGCADETVYELNDAGSFSESMISEDRSGLSGEASQSGFDTTQSSVDESHTDKSDADAAEEINDTYDGQNTQVNGSGDSDKEMIYVYVCGEVASPGVYALPEGSRVYEAVDAAGGLLEGVDKTEINMAQLLSDGQQITVAAEGSRIEGASGTTDENKKVNINTADMEELMTISGIGESRAEDIIEYRSQYGLFSSTEEIMNISGIGEKMYEKIKDDIEV